MIPLDSTQSVMLLEEHPGDRAALHALLREMGCANITEAADGQEGLDALESSPQGFDLVVCNLDMGGMDGLEFVRHAARLGVGGLILYSAHDEAILSSAEWMARAYKAPLLGALRMPLTYDTLAPLLARLHGPYTIYSDVIGQRTGECDREVLDEILTALDFGQFVPYFQPKIDLVTGRLRGVETLVRWQHPELGLLAPAHFIDLMEGNGLIDPLTRQVLEQAATLSVAWRRKGIVVPIAVNVSPLTLERPQAAQQLLGTIAQSQADPSQFIFEITEKAFAHDTTAVLENVLRLRMKGCGIAVDDFGTGYSSLQQINRSPITEVKLDRSFVRRILTDRKALTIVESIINLSTKLELSTVAEGVGTDAQRRRLIELGCDLGQGYLFAEAMDADTFEAWHRERLPVAA